MLLDYVNAVISGTNSIPASIAGILVVGTSGKRIKPVQTRGEFYVNTAEEKAAKSPSTLGTRRPSLVGKTVSVIR